MNSLGWEFGGVVLAHALAVMSPGPDFALVLRQSLVRSRAEAIASAVGIGSGILVHVTVSLTGIGLLVSGSPLALSGLKYGGALYLAWLGWQCLRPKPPPALPTPKRAEAPNRLNRGAWTRGFLTNVLNPKAALFFIAVFSILVSPSTSKPVQMAYGLWLVLATTGWFVFVALVFTEPWVRHTFQRWEIWVERISGIVFLGFALSLLLSELIQSA